MQTIALLRDLFAFDHWATSAFLDIVVPGDGLNLLAHLLASQRIWWARIHGEAPGIERLPELSVAECRELSATMHSLWTEYLAGCSQEHLQETISYTTGDGRAFTTSIGDILMHIVNHGTYHRGQMARALRQQGIIPPGTDYILYVRETRGG